VFFQYDSRPGQIEVGGIFAPAESNKSKKKKKKEGKGEKKSNKKEMKDKESVVEKPMDKVDGMDIDFWLEPKEEAQSNGNGIVEEIPPSEEKEHKKKKKEKKQKKEKKDKKKSKENGDTSKEAYDLISVDGGQYRPLAENSQLKMFFELRKVPLDPDKLAAAVQVRYVLICSVNITVKHLKHTGILLVWFSEHGNLH
jgi:hypothetical protein